MKKLLLILLLGTFMSFSNSEICKETIASFYGAEHHGKRTASNEIFNMYDFTAAHKTLKFGTKVKVTNVNNGKTVVITINDRGPFKRTPDFKYYSRVLDLAKGAFLKIAPAGAGVIKIKYEILE